MEALPCGRVAGGSVVVHGALGGGELVLSPFALCEVAEDISQPVGPCLPPGTRGVLPLTPRAGVTPRQRGDVQGCCRGQGRWARGPPPSGERNLSSC